jgi:ABC-type polysaccharide/polyol phosphate transport system ATPase subunit
MTSIVEFHDVTKEFDLRRPQSRSFRTAVAEWLPLPGMPRPQRETFVALRGVSFDVPEGETFGIIGENGSGKSTILKLVTRIFAPTSGRVVVRGRVAALLELGAGFHPELTGRENIYLNGSILGMSHREIDNKLDEIVAFTEIEPFIDVPVKHYSSGMFMRLGFAVAVHVNPQLLLVDEVLSVGDYNFQRKCLERIDALREGGMTIIFVSHDLDSVRKLCTHVAWLEHGNVRTEGPTDVVVNDYLAYMITLQAHKTPSTDLGQQRFGTYEAEITGVEFLDAEGRVRDAFLTSDHMVVRIHYDAHQRIEGPVFGVAFYDSKNINLTGPNTQFSGYTIDAIEGKGAVDMTVEELPFLDGTYRVTAAIYDETRIHPFDSHEKRYRFSVIPGGVHEQYGMIHLPVTWEHRTNDHD